MADPDMRGDTAVSIDFLQQHTSGWGERGWFVQLVAIEPAQAKDHKPLIEATSVLPAEIDTLEPWIKSRQGRSNLYFSVNPLKHQKGKKATKADIAALACRHADIDPREGEPLASERTRIFAAVQAFPIKPTALVNSGNGVGVFWRLNTPIPTVDGNFDELEDVNRRLAHALGADNCHNIDRIMRLPGTINLPDWRKAAKGRVPVPTTLLYQNEVAYTLKDFNFLPPMQLNNQRAEINLGVVDEAALAAHLQAVRVDPELSKLQRGAALPWMRDASRSGFDFALASVLARLGFTNEEIATLLLRYPHGKAAERQDVEKYIGEILGKVRARIDASAASAPGFPTARHLTTDQANASRLHRAAGCNVMFSGGRWYIWTGTHWSADEAAAYRQTCNLSALILDEANEWEHRPAGSTEESEKNKEIAEALRKWARQSEMKPRLDAAFQLLRRLVEVPAETLDADPYLLNVRNGTVDLRTGRLRPHDKADRITRLIHTAYKPEARAPLFEKALAEITGEAGLEKKPMAEFQQRWFGYCATALVSEQKFAVHHGDGANGKSSLLGTMERVLGPYAGTAAPGLLVGGAHDRHPTELADLRGKRMVTAHESGEDGALREEFIKRVTGGDRIKARHMRQDFFEFDPSHKVQLVTNHKPQIRGQDHAIWRRVLLVPYNITFGTAEAVGRGEAHRVKNDALAEALKAEDEGILAWIVKGALKWRMLGLNPPDAVLAAGAAYRVEQDRVGQFMQECCKRHSDAVVPLKLLYIAYQRWAKDCGFLPLGRNKFAEAVEKRPGIESKATDHGKVFTGVDLRSPFGKLFF